ncbi:hypothetical protein F2P56_034583 [Juglans regia]|uniref:Uncharacterized protein LOC108993054 n=2 Tax=Juglans regia TaxID=51240 RepID=A0A2I4EVE8_JUGRE|nr:uncharacterized protein LOC108993054 [Juglans regia]KAF5445537.1 hypothetical protein F2P56_034583 [Juglans regia]
MTASLIKTFIMAEVKEAIFNMNPLGSPSLDGFLVAFYQNYWETVGPRVSAAVLEVQNDTYIALVWKSKSPLKVTEFRPIGLCNVFYKIIAKILANRLKVILPDIISSIQSAVVPGRLITDNVIVAFESMHIMKTRMKGKEGFMALKLQMSKAYDKEKFTPSRGIRKGDPHSSYLFILCFEVLSNLLNIAEASGLITGTITSSFGLQLLKDACLGRKVSLVIIHAHKFNSKYYYSAYPKGKEEIMSTSYASADQTTYIFFYGGTNMKWVTGLASKVEIVAEASNRITGIRFGVSHRGNPQTVEASLLQNVRNSNPADRDEVVEELKHFIQQEHSEGWLVLTENGSVFEKGYGRSVLETMDAFETEWKKDVERSRNFGRSFKDALGSRPRV